jgi:hypothetical protein
MTPGLIRWRRDRIRRPLAADDALSAGAGRMAARAHSDMRPGPSSRRRGPQSGVGSYERTVLLLTLLAQRVPAQYPVEELAVHSGIIDVPTPPERGDRLRALTTPPPCIRLRRYSASTSRWTATAWNSADGVAQPEDERTAVEVKQFTADASL